MDQQRLLHGILLVKIEEIDRLHTVGRGFNLCNKNITPQKVGKRFLGQVKRMVLCDTQVTGPQLYATVDLDKARVARTRRIKYKSSKLEWNESFRIYCAHWISHVVFTVKDDDSFAATLIGRAYVPARDIKEGFLMERRADILDEDNHPIGSKIRIMLQYFSATSDSNWSRGINSSQYEGVPYTFFRQRNGCKVTLYQDAHVPDDYKPLTLSGGVVYTPQRCWKDIYEVIRNAQHFIYVAGWSVYAKIALIRDPTKQVQDKRHILGELLKQKAEEGVVVLVLIWDNKEIPAELKKHGFMTTHEEDTKTYFENSKVHCILCPRNPGKERSYVQGFEVSGTFTHHQKTVVADYELPDKGSQKRGIVSFVGGIDLCDGRYDTKEHPLFKTLDTIHYYDFHQPNFSGSSIGKGGPREPWHDIHCKLEGPIAWDVLYNFEQRWLKQVGKKFLIPRKKLAEITIPPSTIMSLDDPEAWNVQLFRSIDHGSVIGFPEGPYGAANVGLVSGKDNIFDRSIQDAYINAIRRAKNFIYIENQYFLGSSFGWRASDIKVEEIGALHLIPKELSLKIVSKIEAEERFVVYIVIPMWPEGKPESGPVQAILDWQKRTMQMMYSDITQALHRKGLDTDPKEYLTFFCLGNRETKKIGEYAPPETPEANSNYIRAQEARRFMIYVHAKMMIVDDEYVIVGSANTNQRSMDGTRDTEIAMGAFQPRHLATPGPARGQIYAFRMGLWHEHVGSIQPSFDHPESVECVREVNRIAGTLWKTYSDNTFDKDLPGHLLSYPVNITVDGTIVTLPETDVFPDTNARVLGAKSDYLPPILTT